MKNKIIVLLIFHSLISVSLFSQNKHKVLFDGMYIAKTGEINTGETKMEIYTYVRFYDDGTVYMQTVNEYNPTSVSKWFGKNGTFSKMGKFEIENDKISFMTSNDNTLDKKLLGKRSIDFNGKIINDKKLILNLIYVDSEIKDVLFEFATLN
ncbi:MAG: hypothetical protein GYB35_16550 [Algicola sp.]|nr:hypothetical protein [Algicola sp.]